ncbi:MAG: hypothetical protein ACK5LM_02665, partial [Lactovum sp.]
MVQKIIQDKENPKLFYLDNINFSADDPELQRALFFEKMRGVEEIQVQTKKIRQVGISKFYNFTYNYEIKATEESEVIPLSFLARKPHLIFDDLETHDKNMISFLNLRPFRSLIRQLNELLSEDFFVFYSEVLKREASSDDFIQPINLVSLEEQDRFFKISGTTLSFHQQTLQLFFDNEDNFEKDQRSYYSILSFLFSLLKLERFPALDFPLADYFERRFSFNNLEKIENELLVRKLLTQNDLNKMISTINASVNYWRVTEVMILTYFDDDIKKFLSNRELRHVSEYYYADSSNKREYFFDHNGMQAQYIGAWDYESESYEIKEILNFGNERRIVLKHKTQSMISEQKINIALTYKSNQEIAEHFSPLFIQAEIISRIKYDLVQRVALPETVTYELVSEDKLLELKENKLYLKIDQLIPSENYELLNTEELEKGFELELGEDQGLRLNVDYQLKSCQLEIAYYDINQDTELIKKEALVGFAGQAVNFQLDLPENYDFLSDNREDFKYFSIEKQVIDVLMCQKHEISLEEITFKLQIEGVPEEMKSYFISNLERTARIEIDHNFLTDKIEKRSIPEILEIEVPEFFGYEKMEEEILSYDPSKNNFKSFTQTLVYQPIKGVIKFTFLDKDSENKELLHQFRLSGEYGQFISQEEIQIPENFEIISNLEEKTLTFYKDFRVVIIELAHKRKKIEKTVTYTVRYESIESSFLKEMNYDFSYNMVTDLVTGKISYEASEDYPKIDWLKIPNYQVMENQSDGFTFEVDPEKESEDQQITIICEPMLAIVTVKYIDKERDNQILSPILEIEGVCGEIIDILSEVPENYELINPTDIDRYQFTEKEQELEIYLQHQKVVTTELHSLEVRLSGVPIDPNRITKVFEVEVEKDLVTNENRKSSKQEEISIKIPEFQGYQLSEGQPLKISYQPSENGFSDKKLVVQYERVKSKISVSYVDDDENDSQVGELQEFEGIYGSPFFFEIDIPENYQLFKSPNFESIHFGKEEQHFTIKLRHRHEKIERRIVADIRLIGVPIEPSSFIRLIEFEERRDLVTGKLLESTNKNRAEIRMPEIPGYHLRNPEENIVVINSYEEFSDSQIFNIEYEKNQNLSQIDLENTFVTSELKMKESELRLSEINSESESELRELQLSEEMSMKELSLANSLLESMNHASKGKVAFYSKSVDEGPILPSIDLSFTKEQIDPVLNLIEKEAAVKSLSLSENEKILDLEKNSHQIVFSSSSDSISSLLKEETKLAQEESLSDFSVVFENSQSFVDLDLAHDMSDPVISLAREKLDEKLAFTQEESLLNSLVVFENSQSFVDLDLTHDMSDPVISLARKKLDEKLAFTQEDMSIDFSLESSSLTNIGFINLDLTVDTNQPVINFKTNNESLYLESLQFDMTESQTSEIIEEVENSVTSSDELLDNSSEIIEDVRENLFGDFSEYLTYVKPEDKEVDLQLTEEFINFDETLIRDKSV